MANGALRALGSANSQVHKREEIIIVCLSALGQGLSRGFFWGVGGGVEGRRLSPRELESVGDEISHSCFLCV